MSRSNFEHGAGGFTTRGAALWCRGDAETRVQHPGRLTVRLLVPMVVVGAAVAAGCGASPDSTSDVRSSGADVTAATVPVSSSVETSGSDVEIDGDSVPAGSMRLDVALSAGQSGTARVGTLCGVSHLQFGGEDWVATEAPVGSADWIPDEWRSISGSTELIDIEIDVSEAGDAFVATAGERSVDYRRATADDGEFLCS